jgi:exonuclease VII small subunit
MAFKIKAADMKRLEESASELETKRSALEDAVNAFNEELAAARATLQESVDAYNEAAESIRAQIQDIHNELSEQFADRSEKWQEGDTGQRVSEWLDNLEHEPERISDVSLDEFPEELDFEELVNDGDNPVEVVNELVADPLNDE